MGSDPRTESPVALESAALESAAEQLDAVARADREPSQRRAWIRLGLAGLILGLGLWAALNREGEPEIPEAPEAGSVVWVDVEGWYGRTPHEVAVTSPFQLALDALPAGLPMQIGDWRGEDRPGDPEVDVWFRDPDVKIERTYRRDDGEIVWLSAFGSRGDKSFHLFEHTPDLCYPLGGWEIEDFDLAQVELAGPRPLPINLGFASGQDGQMVFLYFYVWDTPARAAERGVLSIRIAAPVRRDSQQTLAMLTEDFVARIFPQTLAWSHF